MATLGAVRGRRRPTASAEQLTRIRRARGIPRRRIAREARISRASMDRYEKVKFPALPRSNDGRARSGTRSC